MHITLHKNFAKGFAKLKPHEQKKFRERRKLFFEDQFHPLLNNHALHGEFAGLRSINITGDLRVIYHQSDERTFKFLLIDTHSNLYG